MCEVFNPSALKVAHFGLLELHDHQDSDRQCQLSNNDYWNWMSVRIVIINVNLAIKIAGIT